MLDNFSPDAVELINRARLEAQSFGHAFVGVEHFLLAFAAGAESPESQDLLARGLNYDLLNRQIKRMLGDFAAHDLELRFNPEAKELLQTAWESVWAPETHISRAHIYKVLLRECGGVIADILRGIGLGDGSSVFNSESIGGLAEKAKVLPVASTNPAPALDQSIHSAASVSWSQSKAKTQSEYEQLLDIELTSEFEIPFAAGDFTEAANFVMLFARIEAATSKIEKSPIDSFCLLVGLALDQAGAAGKLLRRHNVTLLNLRNTTEKYLDKNSKVGDLETVFSAGEVRQIVCQARRQCRKLQQPFVSSANLLWAILSSGKSRARDILGKLVPDLAELKVAIASQPAERYEGSLLELELNSKLYRLLIAGGALEIEDSKKNKPPILNNLQMRHALSSLTEEGLSVLEVALRQLAFLQGNQFAGKHIWLGLLAKGKSPAAIYCLSLGITLSLIRRTIDEIDSALPLPKSEQELSDSVAEILQNAQLIAEMMKLPKAGPDHLFWALAHSDDSEMKFLIERLGLDRFILQKDAWAICRGELPLQGEAFSKFAKTTSAGLQIYSMLCEPAVAVAMQFALVLATEAGVSKVDGAFFLAGLFKAQGPAAGILRGLGVTADTINSAMTKLLVGKISAKINIEPDFDPRLEDAFDRGLTKSLLARGPSLSTDYLLWGLVDSGNPECLALLFQLGIKVSDIIEGFETLRSLDFLSNPLLSDIQRKMPPLGLKLSLEIESTLAFAAETANASGYGAFDLNTLVYALSRTGPVAAKLAACGINSKNLKLFLEKSVQSIGTTSSSVEQIRPEVLDVFTEAAKTAQFLSQDELRCEHLMLAILLSVKPEQPRAGWQNVGLNLNKLAYQLLITEPHTSRSQNLDLSRKLSKAIAPMNLAAKSVIVNAAVIAANLGLNFIDTEHILLAISSSANSHLFHLLERCGLRRAKIESRLSHYCSVVNEYANLPVTYTLRLGTIFDHALELACERDGGPLTVPDLVLALLSCDGGIAGQILKDLDIDAKWVVLMVRAATEGPKFLKSGISSVYSPPDPEIKLLPTSPPEPE